MYLTVAVKPKLRLTLKICFNESTGADAALCKSSANFELATARIAGLLLSRSLSHLFKTTVHLNLAEQLIFIQDYQLKLFYQLIAKSVDAVFRGTLMIQKSFF